MGVRLALLADHYRTDRQWTDESLATGMARLRRWRAAAEAKAGPSGADLLGGVRRKLAFDLDTPGALALVDSWADDAIAGIGVDPAAPALFAQTVDALLGIKL
jgi:L-cysteine:1D-myo-inositol 2-amino-2-deoxy-alpha-D-glucopyranoside ligase